ncbi:hypothetical protein B0T17DRAFT_500030 [Bombardia bombarda]|uniref:Fungal calcium binding protein domain-containing protein n=1 Tax=Bombardia bombarda TaxID=252184 RepID=A0AA39WAP7_9PEZI|nr:hypothetical protein B0T17DRAFT_500030 [Bombardia bombarda]
MQFSIIPVLALLASAMAAPGVAPISEDMDMAIRTTTVAGTSINEAEVFAFAAPASCKILSCINVISEAVCITEAISDADYKGILKCAKKKELCGCAGCYNKLGDFLEKWGIC